MTGAYFDRLGLDTVTIVALTRATTRRETLCEVRELFLTGRTLRAICTTTPVFLEQLAQLIQSASAELEEIKGHIEQRAS